MPSAFRTIFLICVLPAAILAVTLTMSSETGPGFGAIDLLQYWAGAKAFFAGSNPYDPELMLQLERPFGIPGVTLPVLLWNPPLVFPFIIFLAALSFPSAVKVWGLLSVMLLAASVVLLQAAFRLRRRIDRLTLLMLVVFFYPFGLSLFYGQITPLLLIGWSGFIYFLKREGTAAGTIKGGVCLSFTLLKPHLLYLVYVYLIVQSFRERRWETLVGFFAAGAMLLVVSAGWSPNIITWYAQSMSHPPITWQTPTLGSHLQAFFPAHAHAARIAPTIACAVVMLPLFILLSMPAEIVLILLVPISLLTSPYGWVYDQMLLLPICCACVARLRTGGAAAKAATLMLFLANIAIAFSPEGQQSLVWYPAIFLLSAGLTARAACDN